MRKYTTEHMNVSFCSLTRFCSNDVDILVYRSMVIVKMLALSYGGLDLYFFVIVSGINI